MATSAFKSTTRRSAAGDDSPSSSNRSSSSSASSSFPRRSRSLSRFSRPVPPLPDDAALRPGRFVNTARGSGFPEVTLDDLDVCFFSSGQNSLPPYRNDDAADRSQRRGRSVSRHGSKTALGNSVGSAVLEVRSGRAGVRAGSEANSRRRRSVSVVRYQISDSESDLDHSHPSNRIGVKSSSNGEKSIVPPSNTASSNPRPGLRRSLSQKDLKHHDAYSSYSSVLTDDEARDGMDAHSNRNGIEKTIRAVYAQKKVRYIALENGCAHYEQSELISRANKNSYTQQLLEPSPRGEHPIGEDMNSGLYEAMRKELRHAVEEIKLELEQAIGKTESSVLPSTDSTRAVSAIRRNYATKMEKSERRKQDLLAEILREEQHGRELSKIVKELIPDQKDKVAERPLRTRKRSNDRTRMSTRLTEEAEKYIEGFISNIEDTDISSVDGERSDTSSSLVGAAKTEDFQSLAISKSRPVEMDGVVLPWLQWETSNDASSPSPLKMKDTPTTQSWEPAQQNTTPGQNLSNCSASSHGSWSPGVADSHSTTTTEAKSYSSMRSLSEARGLTLDMDEYLKLPSEEDLLWERWTLQQRIQTGNLLRCGHTFL